MTKANNGKGNTVLRDSWLTPAWIIEPIKNQYKIDFDCCAVENNTVVPNFANNFLDIKEGDIRDKNIWMNPPFSKAWIMFEHLIKVVNRGVAIYRCDNLETRVWQKLILPNATWVHFPNHRVNYDGLDGNGARFPSALIGFNVDPPSIKGITLRKWRKWK